MDGEARSAQIFKRQNQHVDPVPGPEHPHEAEDELAIVECVSELQRITRPARPLPQEGSFRLRCPRPCMSCRAAPLMVARVGNPPRCGQGARFGMPNSYPLMAVTWGR